MKVCGQKGHRAADPECPGKSQVHDNNTLTAGQSEGNFVDAHSVYAFDIHATTGDGDMLDLSCNIVDTAVGCNVAGSSWSDDYLHRVERAWLGSLVSRTPSREKFRFRDGRIVPATTTAPAVIAKQALMIT